MKSFSTWSRRCRGDLEREKMFNMRDMGKLISSCEVYSY